MYFKSVHCVMNFNNKNDFCLDYTIEWSVICYVPFLRNTKKEDAEFHSTIFPCTAPNLMILLSGSVFPSLLLKCILSYIVLCVVVN